jgi:hypothetical protein
MSSRLALSDTTDSITSPWYTYRGLGAIALRIQDRVPLNVDHGPFRRHGVKDVSDIEGVPVCHGVEWSVMAIDERWETRRSTRRRTIHDRTAGWQTRPRRALYA